MAANGKPDAAVDAKPKEPMQHGSSVPNPGQPGTVQVTLERIDQPMRGTSRQVHL